MVQGIAGTAISQAFNVLNFGAYSTGVNDSREAFVAAQTAAVNAGGGTVYIPAGTYLISSAITPAAGVKWLGEGFTVDSAFNPTGGTILTGDGTDACFSYNTSDLGGQPATAAASTYAATSFLYDGTYWIQTGGALTWIA